MPSLAEHSPAGLLTEVTADLIDADSGVEFVYRSLDRLRACSNADDLVLVVDDPEFGRQIFRAGRRPIDTRWARRLAHNGKPGLHASSAGGVDRAVATGVVNLCSLALRFDAARHDSLHDGLTGLLNRRAFDQMLTSSCAQSKRYGWSFALLVLDVNGFKLVNDRLGHAAGDAILRAVAGQLRQRLRVGDAAARVGGDEFALVLPNVTDEVVPALSKAIANAIDVRIPGGRISLTVGHAVAPTDAVGPHDLYRIADDRLYEGKRG